MLQRAVFGVLVQRDELTVDVASRALSTVAKTHFERARVREGEVDEGGGVGQSSREGCETYVQVIKACGAMSLSSHLS